jgi:hypothetical protein
MAGYEYKVVPAPNKGLKAKGLKTAEERFAFALQELMNEMGAEGWEYQRADTLPSIERAGLTGSSTNWRHVLVFRRDLTAEFVRHEAEDRAEDAPEIEPADDAEDIDDETRLRAAAVQSLSAGERPDTAEPSEGERKGAVLRASRDGDAPPLGKSGTLRSLAEFRRRSDKPKS